MSVNLKGKTYRNTQEQVLENAKNIEDLLARVKALEEGMPEPKELYMHNVQLLDNENIDEADVIVNFTVYSNSNTPFTAESLIEYLQQEGYNGSTRFIPAVGITDDDNFEAVNNVDFATSTQQRTTYDCTIIGAFALNDLLGLVLLYTEESSYPRISAFTLEFTYYINDENPIRIY